MTEPRYFEEAKVWFRIQDRLAVIVQDGGGGDPVQVVERAIKERDRAADRASALEDQNEAYQVVCVVVDADQHDRLGEAHGIAKDNEIRFILSNPCFELWALLHFVDQGGHISTSEVGRALREHVPGYKKELPFDDLCPGYDDAVERAKRLTSERARAGDRRGNPSTMVYMLTELLQKHGRGPKA